MAVPWLRRLVRWFLRLETVSFAASVLLGLMPTRSSHGAFMTDRLKTKREL